MNWEERQDYNDAYNDSHLDRPDRAFCDACDWEGDPVDCITDTNDDAPTYCPVCGERVRIEW